MGDAPVGDSPEAAESAAVDPASGEPQHPSTRVWVLLYLAQHHVQMGNIDVALAAIDQAIAHTPTVIELHVCRAQILKRAGAYKGESTTSAIGFSGCVCENAKRQQVPTQGFETLAAAGTYRLTVCTEFVSHSSIERCMGG